MIATAATRAPAALDAGTVTWLVAAMAIATVPLVRSLPPWLLVAIVLLGAWRLRGAHRNLPRPRWNLRLAAVAAVLVGFVVSGRIGFGLEAATPVFVAFLWIKLLELNAARDVALTYILVYFLLAGGMLNDQSLASGLYGMCACVAVTASLMRFQARSAALAPGSALRGAGIIAVQAMPVALLLFLLVPRPESRFILDSGQGVSGLSNTLRPGDIASLALSQEVAFRVEFPTGEAPAPGACYWRGLVLWETDGATWMRGGSPGLLPKLPVGVRHGQRPQPAIAHDITLMPHNQRWLYVLDCPLAPIEGTRPLGGLEMHLDRVVSRTITYSATSSLVAQALDPPRSRATQMPAAVDPRLESLAAGWRVAASSAGKVDARRVIDQALAHFATGGFTYTLQPGVMGADPTATFMFERKRGFCGHYASAFAQLMRLAEVPARVVMGYRGGELNPLGGFLLVRQAHAHAWCEVWVDEKSGWQRVDPTDSVEAAEDPAAGAVLRANRDPTAGGPGDEAAWRRELRQYYDFLQARWDRWLLGYDLDKRQRLFAWLSEVRPRTWLLVTLGGLAAATAAVAMARLLRARREDPAERLYGRWCARLAAAGVAREPWEGPLAFAERAAAALPAHAPAIREAGRLYAGLRYGRGGQPEALPALRAALRALDRPPR